MYSINIKETAQFKKRREKKEKKIAQKELLFGNFICRVKIG